MGNNFRVRGWIACVLLGVAQACGAAEALAPALAAAIRRGDAAACGGELDKLLDAADRLAAGDSLKARWPQLRQSRGYTLALAQRELVRVTGERGLAQVLAEPAGRAFLAEFLADREWLESYLASGPVPEDTAGGLAALNAIWSADRAADAPAFRRLATAVALVFNTDPMRQRLLGATQADKNPLTPLARYTFYKESQKGGRLRPLFDDLEVWELRWVVCAPYGNEALAWLQQNVNVPLDKFDDVCWIPRYRGVNDFGNTIQGPLFYAPSRERNNWAQDIAKHGGVCGSLSTFGAVNALAHGVPATTKGQPGHCAYAYRTARGEWAPAFGGPDGGAHYHFWKDSFSYVWLADDAFGDRERMRDAMRLAWQARRAAGRGDAAGARAAYGQSVAAQPLNWAVWQEYIGACLAGPGMGKEAWQALTAELVQGMARHPMPMCELMAGYDEKALYPLLGAEEKRALLLQVHEAVAAHVRPGWTPWNMPEALLPKQLRALGLQEAPGAYFGEVLAAYCRHAHEFLLGQLIDWGSEKLARTAAGKEPFFGAITAALGSGEKLDDKLRKTLLSNAIRATEEARSVAGFQLLGETAAPYGSNEGALSLERPEGGRLVSADGLLYLSGSDGWDQPASHRGVLSEQGGFFHCQPAKAGKDESRWAVVQLRETCALTGLAIANRLSNQRRCTGLKVFASTDEKTWKAIAETDDFRQQWKVDLRGEGVQAKWIKVENATPGSDAFHLRNICVYGEAVK